MAESSVTLADVIATLKNEGSLVRNSGTNSIKSVKQVVSEGDKDLINVLSSLVNEFRIGRLDAEEARRDAIAQPPAAPEPAPQQQVAERSDPGFGFRQFGIAGILTAVAGSVTGAFTGLLEGANKFFRPITRFFTDNAVVRKFKDLFEKAKEGQGKLAMQFDKFIVEPIKAFGRSIAETFRPITQFFEGDGKKSGGLLSRLSTIFKGFFTVFKNVFSKLFAPITIIMGIIDGIKGAFEGFERQEDKGIVAQIFGGITGAIGGIAAGIVGGFADLLKSVVSWIAGALGFEQVETMLDSFNFTDLIKEGYQKITDGIIAGVEAIVGFIKNFDLGETIAGIGNAAANFIKSILRAVLPDPNAPTFSAAGLAAAAIPDAVYEYAGYGTPADAEAPDAPPGTERREVSDEEISYRRGNRAEAAARRRKALETIGNPNVVPEKPATTAREGATAEMDQGNATNRNAQVAAAVVPIVNAPSQNITNNNSNTSMMAPYVPPTDNLDRAKDW